MNVEHYLRVYKLRMEMQNSGITNPSDEIKELTKIIVEKLSHLPLDEEIKLSRDSIKDSKGNLILNFPRFNIE